MKEIYRLFKVQALKHTDENKEHFRVFHNGLNNLFREAKKKKMKFKEAEGNPLKTWQMIHSINGQSPNILPYKVTVKD